MVAGLAVPSMLHESVSLRWKAAYLCMFNDCQRAGITLFSNLYETHSSEGKGDRGKRTSDRARTWDLRSIAEFQPRKPLTIIEHTEVEAAFHLRLTDS